MAIGEYTGNHCTQPKVVCITIDSRGDSTICDIATPRHMHDVRDSKSPDFTIDFSKLISESGTGFLVVVFAAKLGLSTRLSSTVGDKMRDKKFDSFLKGEGILSLKTSEYSGVISDFDLKFN